MSFGLLQPQFKAHHKIHPRLWIALQRLQHRIALWPGYAIRFKDFVYFLFFIPRPLDDLQLLAPALAGIMFGIAARSQITTQSHGDRTSRDLGQTRYDDEVRRS